MTSNVPVLLRHPSRDEVEAYLRWLASSEYCYHLDDDATDLGFPPEVGAILSYNVGVMDADFGWDEIWAAYAGELSARDGRA